MTLNLAGVYKGLVDSAQGKHRCPFYPRCPGYLQQITKTGYSDGTQATADPTIVEPKPLKPKHQYACDCNPAHHTFVATNVRAIYKLKRMKPLWALQVRANEHRIEQGTVLDVEAWKARQPKPKVRLKQGKPLRRWRHLRRLEYE